MVSPLCDMTVTVCRDGRQFVVDGCFFSSRYKGQQDIIGTRLQGKFTLITPPEFPIRVGDRVAPGTDGQNAAPVTWVQPMYLAGSLHHYEAGN